MADVEGRLGRLEPRIDAAGGLGQELKNAVDLLDFARVLAILIVIVALVLVADRLSGALRRSLL